jgi:carboxypeptidase family protein
MGNLIACLFMLVAVGCDIDRRAVEPAAHSGVRGVTRVGPMCPVQSVATPCPDRPIRAAVSVSVSAADSSAVVSSTRTDRMGRFTLRLKPGRYVVVARASTVMPGHQEVRGQLTVVRDTFTDVVLEFDSGIR